MADDLRVGIVADASQLGAEMDSAGVKVESFADRSAAAMERYNAASANGTKAQEALGAAFDRATAAGKSTTEAMEQAVAAYEALNAVSAETVVSQGRVAASINTVGISSRQAATAGIGILEGRMMSGGRAASAFLATTLGLGPALQAAFPVIGAIALGMVIVDVAKEITKFASNAEDLANELNTDWLTGAIGQVDGLADAVKDADKWTLQYAQDVDSWKSKSQEASIETIRLTQGEAAAYRAMAEEKRRAVSGSTPGAQGGLQASLAADQRLASELQTKAQEHNIRVVRTETGAPISQQDQGPTTRALEAAKELESVNERIKGTKAQIATLTEQATNLDLQAAQVKPPKIPRMKPSSGFDEWLSSYKIQEAQSKEITAGITAEWERLYRAQIEEERQATEADKRATEDYKKNHAEQMRALEEQTAAAVKSSEEQEQAANRLIEHRLKMGLEGPHQAASDRTAVSHAAEDEQVASLQNEQAQFHPEQGADQAQKYRALQDQITAIQRKAAAQREQIADQEKEHQTAAYTQMFSQIYQPFQTFMDHWLESGRRMGAALEHMADQYAIATINALVKVGIQELIGLAIHQTVGDQERLDSAKTAAANTYAAVSAIPYVGWLLAPPAAAAAFTAVEAFEQGTDYVPRTGMAMLHEGERVSTRPENQAISKALAGGGSGSAIHYHDHTNFSAVDGSSVEGMYRRNSSASRRQFHRQLRLAGAVQG